MSKPDPPAPPDPVATARAATGTNVSTAIANAFLNNTNQVTPTGAVDYNQTGDYTWTDPSTNSTYTIPRFTATQTLSPQQQAIQNQREATQYNLAGMGNQQSQRVANLLSTPFQTSGYGPTGGNAAYLQNLAPALTSYAGGGPLQRSIGPTGPITNTYGPADNFSADRQRVEDSLMNRMNPQLQQQQAQLQQHLADQGIRYGSTAYNNAMLTYNQQADDARWGAISQAGQEQQRMTEEAQNLAQFQNTAQQQGYEQQLGMGQFANQAQQQQYNQNAAMASFYNQGQAQNLAQQQDAFNAAQAQRNQWLQEQYAQRNQPLNEITSLMAGSQVSQPNFLNTPQSQIPTTDIAGLINNNFNQQMGVYQQQNQQYNSLVGGLLGLGAGALKASDERVKKDVVRIGSVLSQDPDHDEKDMGTTFGAARTELPIYAYSYKNDPASTRHLGPMAQDVEKVDKKAVKTIGGVKHIDTGRVMGNILRAA
jgi:hypothetical protein